MSPLFCSRGDKTVFLGGVFQRNIWYMLRDVTFVDIVFVDIVLRIVVNIDIVFGDIVFVDIVFVDIVLRIVVDYHLKSTLQIYVNYHSTLHFSLI